MPVDEARVAMELNSAAMLQEASRAGLGVAERAESYDVWLVMHADLNRSARVRAAADAIIASVAGQ
ncbi:hypothetical protein [Janthinobacterium sp. LB3P112]|uniref:hypothetical protein n=1 Tax=Janthinobacterium sp. LB3P112 TaxID=3424196 RepID=UPI003F204DBA